MKKYKIHIEQTKEYELELDENIINDDFIKKFEKDFFTLDEIDNDKLASLAYQVGYSKAACGDYEGIGYPLEYGRNFMDDGCENKGLNFTEIDEDDDYYIEIKEI